MALRATPALAVNMLRNPLFAVPHPPEALVRSEMECRTMPRLMIERDGVNTLLLQITFDTTLIP